MKIHGNSCLSSSVFSASVTPLKTVAKLVECIRHGTGTMVTDYALNSLEDLVHRRKFTI